MKSTGWSTTATSTAWTPDLAPNLHQVLFLICPKFRAGEGFLAPVTCVAICRHAQELLSPQAHSHNGSLVRRGAQLVGFGIELRRRVSALLPVVDEADEACVTSCSAVSDPPAVPS